MLNDLTNIKQLSQALVLLVIRENELCDKADELGDDLETAQNCKNAPAIDEILSIFNEVEEEIFNIQDAEEIVLVSMLDQMNIDFLQN